MRLFPKKFLALLAAATMSLGAFAQDYGLPEGIQEGNILHCFNWPLATVKLELPNIAKAGFGAVQVSPLQRNINAGTIWYDVYRPYDFKLVDSSGIGREQDLRDLCAAAEEYGIKVIVDVVMNHVDGTASNKTSLHDPWWNSNGRLRWLGNVNYGDRNSITHNQLGGASYYPDVNSEDAEVAQRAKAYIEQLKDCGVKGIRFDAAKHIALPSEGCEFWAVVTSVPDMFYYGEILEGPGGGNSNALMKEYTKYMSVTDDRYGKQATQANGAPGAKANWANGVLDADKVVYWGESHDTYSNDQANGGWTTSLTQAQIDRGYAIVACRNGATALYFSRPSGTTSGTIKIGQKGSMNFTNKQVAEVNKFRNVMNGRPDAYVMKESVAVVTRQNGGAVIVAAQGAKDVTIDNAGGYCPGGTFTDRVSGNTFTVTKTTISGKVGDSGIAVLYDGELNDDFDHEINPNPDNLDEINGVYFKNLTGWAQPYVWAWNSTDNNCTASSGWPGEAMVELGFGDYWKWEIPASKTMPTSIIFNPGGDDGKTVDLVYVNGAIYDSYGNVIGNTSGIDGIVDDDFDAADAAPVYYNLQGIRVDRPGKGIHIVVRGKKVSKIAF